LRDHSVAGVGQNMRALRKGNQVHRPLENSKSCVGLSYKPQAAPKGDRR
jgi:hypothetical protein